MYSEQYHGSFGRVLLDGGRDSRTIDVGVSSKPPNLGDLRTAIAQLIHAAEFRASALLDS